MLTTREDILREQSRHESEILRRYFLANSAEWVKQKLGEDIWSGQREIIESVRVNRKTAAITCHEVGKSFVAARIVAWWLSNHPPGTAKAVTTAPTGRQVRAILWNEIRTAHAKGQLPGRTNQTEWHLQVQDSEKLVGFGFKPADRDPTSFQGLHAEHMLVVGDESCGLPQSILDAMLSLIANDNGRLLLLGNPDDPTAPFFHCCKPGSGYNVISISAFDTPEFTGEMVPKDLLPHLIGRVYVEEKRKSWAPNWQWTEDGSEVVPPPGANEFDTHPFWQSKVLGRFPQNSEQGSLIPLVWIRAAQARELAPVGANELGVDVGGGGDSSTIAQRRGPVVRILSEDRNPDTMQTCGKVIAMRKQVGASRVKVDRIGIGAGVVHRGLELGEPFVGIGVGDASSRPEEFANLKAELWWNVRTAFETGTIDLDPEDEDTAAELCSIRYFRTSSGKIQIESKEQARRRGVRSPNRAEAIMLVMADPVAAPSEEPVFGGLVW